MLFKEIQLGNSNAFDEFFLRYYEKLVSFAMQYTKQMESAEEITSELLVKIWLKRAALYKVTNPEVYLFVSIKNACLNWLRSDKKKNTLFVAHQDELPLMPQSGQLEEKELIRILDLCVAALPEQRRMIFRLIKEQGLKRQEVAEILGLSIRTVENQLHQALISLADAISGYLGYNPRKRKIRTETLSDLSAIFFL